MGHGCIGASGAIAGMVILFALNYPRATILLFFVIPMPAWLAGVLFVGLDMLGAFGGRPGSNIAFSAHLAGAAFAFVYYQQRWNLTRLTQGFRWPQLPARRKPRLRVHRPEQDLEPGLNQEVDRILEKISRAGRGQPHGQRAAHAGNRQPRVPEENDEAQMTKRLVDSG